MNDSFEEIIKDALLGPCGYASKRGAGPNDNIKCEGCMFCGPGSCQGKMGRDLVRRCKEVAAGEPCSRCDVADDEREGGYVSIGKVATFPGVNADKAQALKVLEEAAEVFSAWQAADDGHHNLSRFLILNECADNIQTTCNLLAALGVADFEPYMDACRERNEERGRL